MAFDDELDRRTARDLARPRFKIHGVVLDQVIDTGGPAFEIRICRMAPHSAWEQLIVRAHNLELVYHRICTLRQADGVLTN